MRKVLLLRRGFTLIELMIVVAIIGILAAVAIPSFIRYTRKSKTMEAVMMIRRMYDGAVAYYIGEHVDKSGTQLHQKFPDSTGPTPTAGIPCGKPVLVAQSEWGTDSWQALDFAVTDPQRFQYEFQDNGLEGADAFATMVARGDLNCNTVPSLFARTITGIKDGVMGSSGLIVVNEIE
jgi:prepilin-type N-terminal cleavage/methylation domain-containing protein